MRHPLLLSAAVLVALALAAPAAWAGLESPWRAFPARASADSIERALRVMELRGGPGVRPGEAAFALGQLHYARGEYRQAADAYLRASARLGGADRIEARYAYALSALALGNAPAARTAFGEVAAGDGPRRPLALLGMAQCWEAENRPEKAWDVLRGLVATAPGEAGPAALERLVALAGRLHRDADGAAARSRLVREYPASIETARLPAAPPAAKLVRKGPASRLPAP